MTTVKTKAKRKISKFNFEAEGSAVALVSASQGGAANSFKTLVIKSADKFSKEFIEKAQKVQVTMEFDDFLVKFFGMWREDAKILSSLLGFSEDVSDNEEDDLGVYNDDYFYEWFDEKLGDDRYRSPTEEDKKAWLEYRKQGITLIKSLAESDNKLEMLAALSEQDYWSVINEQKLFEKALKQKDLSGGKPTKGVNPKQTKASKADTQENKMTQETIEKAQYDAKEVELQKALADIQKAKEEIELFKAKEKEAVEKAREAEVVAAVVDVDASAKLFKAVKDLDAEAFKDVVDVVKALTAKVDESEMFKEKGSPEEGVKVAKSAVQAELDKLLKKA